MNFLPREGKSTAMVPSRSPRRRPKKSGSGAPKRVRKNGTTVEQLAPDDQVLREFVADLYAAFSMMRILRQHVARTVDLSSAEFSVLLAVWHLERQGDMTVRAIADHLHVAAAHVTTEIGKLVARDLLIKTSHPSDKRSVGIGLTKFGRRLFHRVMPMLREINDHLFVGIDYDEMVVVHRFLGRIIEQGGAAVRVTETYMPNRTSQRQSKPKA
jgi:DNA-binding MarR family transcriptional regulator